ncbi:hypothetical protein BurJ1DRAFT_3169 [Burkholderiales bacterium JOSHI_001]|nr:hypothetical protein BurJ1DRAFT_3169 [Burkholderiales bacterium JOSHI_001]
MRSALKALAALLLGMLLMLLAAEFAMQLLPVVTGRIRAQDESRWPLHNYEPHTPYTYSFGWDLRNVQSGRVNNFGQLAPFDFAPGRALLAVIGDSYVESAMNPYQDTLQAQLAARLGRSDAAIGLAGSGLSLADYVALAGQAHEELAPKALVVVVIDADITESLVRRRGWHHLEPSRGAGTPDLTYLPLRQGDGGAASGKLFRSSLYRYLRRNLGWTPPTWDSLTAGLHRATPQPVAPASRTGVDAMLPVLDTLLDELLRRSAVPAGCVALLVDSDRPALYGRPPTKPVDAPELRSALIQRATMRGMGVVDLAPRFEAHHRHHGRQFDHSPVDRHWNALGHSVAAEAAQDALRGCPALAPLKANGGNGSFR